MKYLTEERFIVNSNDKQSLKNYRDNYDRIFGTKDEEPAKAEPGPDEVEMRFVTITHFCKVCSAYVPDPENHQYHVIIDEPARTDVDKILGVTHEQKPLECGCCGAYICDMHYEAMLPK